MQAIAQFAVSVTFSNTVIALLILPNPLSLLSPHPHPHPLDKILKSKG